MENTSIHNHRIYMEIGFDQQDLIALVKMRPEKQWHTDQKRWSLPDTPENRAWAGIRPNLDHVESAAKAPAAATPPVGICKKLIFKHLQTQRFA